MALAAEYAAMFEQLAATPGPAITEVSVAEGREMYRLMRPINPEISVGHIEDRVITPPAGRHWPANLYATGQRTFRHLRQFSRWWLGDW